MEEHQDHHVLQQIESNTLPVLELTKEIEEINGTHDDLRYDDVAPLVRALARNESIRCVRFEGDFLDCLHPLRRSELLRVVGDRLPNVSFVCLGDSPLPVADLCHLVTESKSLRALHLHDSILQGSPEDFRALEEALTDHPTIREIEIHECTSAIPGTNLKTLQDAGKRRSPTPSYRHRSPLMLYRTKQFHLTNRQEAKTKT
mmetsp:Transcript_10648/g.25628  ORF Transcript_10648/g.25628 Transcript_10648/m.25628 type:complete len:202 (-) Transcript_10648:66-671(-)